LGFNPTLQCSRTRAVNKSRKENEKHLINGISRSQYPLLCLKRSYLCRVRVGYAAVLRRWSDRVSISPKICISFNGGDRHGSRDVAVQTINTMNGTMIMYNISWSAVKLVELPTFAFLIIIINVSSRFDRLYEKKIKTILVYELVACLIYLVTRVYGKRSLSATNRETAPPGSQRVSHVFSAGTAVANTMAVTRRARRVEIRCRRFFALTRTTGRTAQTFRYCAIAAGGKKKRDVTEILLVLVIWLRGTCFFP